MEFHAVIAHHASNVPDDAEVHFFLVYNLVFVVYCSYLVSVTVDYIGVV